MQYEICTYDSVSPVLESNCSPDVLFLNITFTPDYFLSLHIIRYFFHIHILLRYFRLAEYCIFYEQASKEKTY